MPEVHVSAVVLRNKSGEVLLVRKRGTKMWMNPGGKPEPGEDARQCAVREVREELGLELDPDRLVSLEKHTAQAANEPGFNVVANCFVWPDPIPETTGPHAEISEVRWNDMSNLDDETLSPLLVQEIYPLL